MCVNLKYIKNRKPKSDFNLVTDRLYNVVPCNHCHECLELHHNDYVVRSVAEYQNNRRLGGSTFYYTLTYNEENVPKFDDMLVFDKKDCQNFFKSLRQELNYPNLKYFLTSELGKNTHRPHYHVLFFLYGIDKKKLYKAVEKTWKNGFIYPGRNYGVVDCEDAVKYVAKYVSKDFNVLNYYEKDKNYNQNLDFRIKKYNKEHNTNLQFKNFHLQSEKFGICLNRIITDDSLVSGNVTLITSSVGKKKDDINDSYPIPLYNKRKLMYDIFKNPKGNVIYRLNYRGIKIRLRQYLIQIKNDAIYFNELIKNFDNYFRKYNLIYYDKDYIQFLTGLVDPYELSIYKNFYRGLPCNGFYRFDFSEQSLIFNLHVYFNNYYNNISLKSSLTSKYKTLIVPKFDDESYDIQYYQVKIFDRLLDFINLIKLFDSYDSYLKRTTSYNTSQYYRYLKTGKYKPLEFKSIYEFSNNLNKNNVVHCNINQALFDEQLKLIQDSYEIDKLNEIINLLKLEKKCSYKNVFNNSDVQLKCFPLDVCPF